MSYFSHLHANYNTWKAYKSLPRHYQRRDGMFPSETYFKYRPDENFGGRKVLNLGCGTSFFRAPNVTNLDTVPGDGINAVWDLSKVPLPFEDESFDLILANHVVEHIPGWFECFKDLARVLKTNGTLEIWTPPVSSDTATTFRDHINSIGIRSFDGCGPSASGGANALAASEFKQYTHLKRLVFTNYQIRPIVKWWTMLAPVSVLGWMVQHLRNIASEENYLFRKNP